MNSVTVELKIAEKKIIFISCNSSSTNYMTQPLTIDISESELELTLKGVMEEVDKIACLIPPVNNHLLKQGGVK